MITTLTVQESTKYAHLKREIAGNVKIGRAAWASIRKSIIEIHDQKLYRDEFKTYEEFCRNIVGLSSDRVNQLIENDVVVEALPRVFAEQLGKNERACRELKKAPESQRPSVVESIVSKGEPITTKTIKAEVAKLPPAAKNGEHKVEVDNEGWPLTPTAKIYWHRRQEVQDLLTKISRLKSEIEAIADRRDDLFFGINFASADSDLSSLYSNIANAKPHAVCHQCGGHPERQPTKCPFCHGKGMVSKFRWDTFVPEEVKAIRARQVHK